MQIYSGCGNQFLLFDNRIPVFNFNDIASLSRQYETDGVVLLENSRLADYCMRIFNKDGSEAAMCGNGLRCLIKFLEDLGQKQPKYQIETQAGILSGFASRDGATVSMPNPSKMQIIEIQNMKLHYLNTGVPHAVLFVDDVSKIEVEKTGRLIRFHPAFAPHGTNVNFVCVKNKELQIRTYERGVEGETLACGTGAVAAALAAAEAHGLKSPIHLISRSGESLEVSLNPLTLTGPVQKLIFQLK